jgi:hypothetical protein
VMLLRMPRRKGTIAVSEAPTGRSVPARKGRREKDKKQVE